MAGRDVSEGGEFIVRAIVVGAGIGGLCAAIALRKIGIDARVYESKPEIRFAGAGLGIGANAVEALQRLGVVDEVLRAGKTLDELRIVTPEGKLLQRTESAAISRKYGPANVAIDRGRLLELLLGALGPEQVVFAAKTCSRFEQHGSGVKVWFEDGTTEEADLLIGADGIHSVIRSALLPGAKPRYAGYTCWRAVVEADPRTIPYDPNVFIETWGRRGRFGLVPLADDRVYWFACVNAQQARDPVFFSYTANDLAKRFEGYREPIPGLLRLSSERPLLHHDIYQLPPIRRFAFGRIALLGDAAHAMTPNMGQGAGQAVEDAVVLAFCLGNARTPEEALRAYERERIGRTSRIARMSDRLGRAAQLDGRVSVALRDALFPLVPEALLEKQMQYLYEAKLPTAFLEGE